MSEHIKERTYREWMQLCCGTIVEGGNIIEGNWSYPDSVIMNSLKLFYHAYDHTKSMFWANPVTGQSPHFWGRAVGWLGMAAVDTLDFFPKEHEGRNFHTVCDCW